MTSVSGPCGRSILFLRAPPHDATNYLASGVDITYVQAALGHSDIQMTLRNAGVGKEALALIATT